ncbi:MAG: PLP-dependent aminotransferase family protein [Rhodothermales bacterium]
MIEIDRTLRTPVYLQITNGFIRNITAGLISAGHHLPGSRKMAEMLCVNRRTVITAYEELTAQGWLQIKPSSGAYVSEHLPVLTLQPLHGGEHSGLFEQSNFDLKRDLDFLGTYTPSKPGDYKYTIDTGYPDVRLAPLSELTSASNGILKSGYAHKVMKYATDFRGDLLLRQEVAKYLLETRCIRTTPDHIMLVRGSLNAFFSLFQVLLTPGDAVVVGNVSFQVANKIVKLAHGKLLTVPLDEKGIDVKAIAEICRHQKIKAVFVMPHHHHPTTVTLCADRRLELLMLAQQHQFAIIEDDYDYDFHYARNPILPIASSDQAGNVIYVGSFSKTIAPSLRTGFIVAPKNVVDEIANLSRFIDCHGNTSLERAIALLFQDGVIRRHLKKSLKIYHQRRDHFCQLMKDALGEFVDFEVPQGGLAVWVQFDEAYPVLQVHAAAKKKGLRISDTIFHDEHDAPVNAIRMGFASLNEAELTGAISILKDVLETMRGRQT